MKQVNYDVQQYQSYARGRAMLPEQMNAWIAAFAARLPGRRPLHGLDLGSGTGRFTPALAEAFGPAIGVEPSAKMRQIARSRAPHPDVEYRSGSAEAIPLPDGSVDYTLMFLAWHHVQDKVRAACDSARATRSGGTLLLRSQFRDHMPRLWWLQYFPRGFEADASMYEPLADVIDVFRDAGWEVASFAADRRAGRRQSRRTRGAAAPQTVLDFRAAHGRGDSGRVQAIGGSCRRGPRRAATALPGTLLTLTRT